MRRPSMVPCFLASLLCSLPLGAAIEGDTWFPMGPAPICGGFEGGDSGRASAIAVNPFNADEIWLGTAAGGVWHTRDGGVSWEPISDREASLAIGAIALDGCTPSGCGRVFAGTGENAIRRDTYYGAGLLVGEMETISDGIEVFRWTLRGREFRYGSINDIVLDPDISGGSSRLFITLSSGVTVAAPESTVTAPEPAAGFGIHRSDDAGNTWTKLTVAGAEGAKPTDLEMAATPEKQLYAGFMGRGVFRSTDGGDSWCPLNAGIPVPSGCPALTGLPPITDDFDFVEIAIAPSDPSVIYASFGMCPDPLVNPCAPAIYRSNDGGNNWTQQRSGSKCDDYWGCYCFRVERDENGVITKYIQEPTCPTGQAAGYSRYTHGLAVDPTDPDVVLAAGIHLWRSTDAARTFSRVDEVAQGPQCNGVARGLHPDHREIVFHPTGRAYATNDGGFATSTDRGQTWSPRNEDLQITGFQGIASSPLTTMVFGTSQDNGGQIWNGSRQWKWAPGCLGDGGFAVMDFDNQARLYAEDGFGVLSRSADGGASCTKLSPVSAEEDRLFYAPFVQAPSESSPGVHALYYGTTRLYRSTDDGTSWTAVSPVLATDGAFADIVTNAPRSGEARVLRDGTNVVSAIAIAPSDPARVWVGYYGGELFRSDPEPCDAASCWQAMDAALPSAPVTGIAIDPDDATHVVVSFSRFEASQSRIWHTSDNGASWSPGAGLPSGVPANTVAFEAGPPTRVYAGLDSTPDGVSLYRSTDGGANWSPFGKGLPNAPVFQLSVNETFGRIYAATHGRGAFVLSRPFLSSFEGWVDDQIWDIPVYGQNFLPSQSCTLEVLQSDGTTCASGELDVMGGTIGTDADGVLETDLASMWSGRKVAWACFSGQCVGGVPIEDCYDDEDGDGVKDPLSSLRVICDGELATAQVVGCPPLDNPPSTVITLPTTPSRVGASSPRSQRPIDDPGSLAPAATATVVAVRDFAAEGFRFATADGTVEKTALAANTDLRAGGIIASNVDAGDRLVEVRRANGATASADLGAARAGSKVSEAPHPRSGSVLHLTASVQRRLGTQSLCTTAVPYVKGEPAMATLERAQESVLANATCSAAGVRAVLDRGDPGSGELRVQRQPQLRLDAPSITGGQLVTALGADPGATEGQCLRIGGMGVPVVNAIHILGIVFSTAAEGAAGGEVTLIEETPLGSCAITVPTSPGQSGAAIAAAIESAMQTPGIPGPHPGCPARLNPRDLRAHDRMLISVFASGITLCSHDAGLGFAFRPEELLNVHPVANAGEDLTVPLGDSVRLDASASSDPDSTPGTADDIVLYEWFDASGTRPVALGTGATLILLPLPAGPHRLQLRVTDKGGLADLADLLLSVDGGAAAKGSPWRGSFHIGSTHPLGDLSDVSDASIHLHGDLSYTLNHRLRLQGILGFSQLTAESAAGIEHPHFLHLTVGPRVLFPAVFASGTFFAQAGVGAYRTKAAVEEFGFRLGLGLELPLRAPLSLEIGSDYHRVNGGVGKEEADFVTFHLGVSFR